MKKILVNGLLYGQLGNRLFLIAHTIAHAIEFKTRLIISNHLIYKDFLELRNNNKSIYFINNKFVSYLISFISKISQVFFRKIKKLESITVNQYVTKNFFPIILLNRGNLHENEMIYKHREKIIDILNFKKSFRNEAGKFIKNIRSYNKHKKIIGVHIRRNDYINWKDGIYYYEIYEYQQIMKYLEKMANKDVVFVICSDENISLNNFNAIQDDVIISNHHFITDILILSMCDLIVGPPSTFSAWASFLGEVPLYTVKKISHIPEIEDFKINKGNILELTE